MIIAKFKTIMNSGIKEALLRSTSKEEKQSKMRTPTRCYCFLNTLLTLFCIISSSCQPGSTSGVFELELVDFQRLDAQQTNNRNHVAKSIRMLICLKEAFTSQLDGACTYGNASLAWAQEHHTSSPTTNNNPAQHELGASSRPMTRIDSARSPIAKQQQQQETVMTNVVGIQFNYKWTKSFTIILSAELIGADTDGARTNKSSVPQANGLSASNLIIDRHVLTENEVLPTQEASLNRSQSWTNRFQRSLKSSISYKFRVYCAPNHFGDDCNTYCRPRDDNFGHYDCSNSGQRQCHDGWQGVSCDKVRCRQGCNQLHGFCDKPDTCQCRPGWTGPRCDECITYPGCQNGYCLSPWQCICHSNWGGVLCDQDLNYCGSHDPCQNNGTCHSVAPGRYKCSCPEKFAGVSCEIKLSGITQLSAGCALNPCLNGGQCYGYTAESQNNTLMIGRRNESRLEADSLLADENGNEPVQYRCHCRPGWTGDYCQWAESLSLPIDMILGGASTQAGAELPMGTSAFPTDVYLTESNQLESERNLSLSINLPATVSSQNPIDEGHQIAITLDQHHEPLEMRHLISGVVVASAVGVFAAAMMLAWCCLVAIEKNGFSFIQMNVIRASGVNPGEQSDGRSSTGICMSSTFRRMQEKIRDSFRRGPQTRQIRPETKLSIENVLRPPKVPPPSYEESNYTSRLDLYGKLEKSAFEGGTISCWDTKPQDFGNVSMPHRARIESSGYEEERNEVELCPRGAKTCHMDSTEKNDLVEINSHEVVVPFETNINGLEITDVRRLTESQLNCPRHGHLYRNQQQYSLSDVSSQRPLHTTIRIELTDHQTNRNDSFSRDLG